MTVAETILTTPSPTTPPSEFTQTITNLTTPPPSSSSSEPTRRTAAVASALLEVIQDRLPPSSSPTPPPPTPAAFFTSTLSALSATLTIPDDRDDDTSSSSSSSPTTSSPQLPLLEIMRQVTPHVAQSNPKLYITQFALLSRTLRAVASSLPRSSSVGGGGGGEGYNALLRQVLRTATAVLMGVLSVLNEGLGEGEDCTAVEKEAVKCLQGTIVDCFEDGRAKVRRLAHASAWELLRFGQGDGGEGRRKRGIVEEYLVQYCHRILSSFLVTPPSAEENTTHKRKHRGEEDEQPAAATMTKDRAVRILHLLSFLESSLSTLDRPARVLLGEDLVRLVGFAVSFAGTAGGGGGGGKKSGIADGSGVYDVLLANGGLNCLLAILDDPPGAPVFDSVGSLEPKRKKKKKKRRKKDRQEEEEEEDGEGKNEEEFRMRTWASLLRMNLSLRSLQSSFGEGNGAVGGGGGGGGGPMGECRIAYARCIVSVASHLPPSSLQGKGDTAWNKVASKLLPLSFTSIMNIIDHDDASPSSSSVVVVQGLCGEMQRIVRSPTLSHFLTTSSSSSNDEPTQVVQAVVSSIERILHYRYRSSWANGGLSCLSSLVVTIVQGILPPPSPTETTTTTARVEYDQRDVERADGMVKPLLDGLSRLYSDLTNSGKEKKRKDGSKDVEAMKRALKGTMATVGTGVGIRFLFSVVDIVESSAGGGGGGMNESKAWIVSALVEHSPSSSLPGVENAAVGPYPTNLEFFQKVILGMARRCDVLADAAAAAADKGGEVEGMRAKVAKGRVVELWSLFPLFCGGRGKVEDLRETFMGLAQILVRAMGDVRYPQLLSIICSGLSQLAQLRDADFDDDDDRQVLSEVSVKLLPALFKLVETLHGSNAPPTSPDDDDDDDDDDEDDDESMEDAEDGGANKKKRKKSSTTKKKNPMQDINTQRAVSVTNTIAAYAPLAPLPYLKGLFKKIMERLLVATTSVTDGDSDKPQPPPQTLKICTLLNLAQSILSSHAIPSSDTTTLSLLYRTLRPILRTDVHHPRVQKRAYAVLACLSHNYTSFLLTSERITETTDLLVGSTAVLHISARGLRLRCLLHLINGLDCEHNATHRDIIPDVMGEVLLSLKDANGKTRETAYELLLALTTARGDITQIIHMILAALAAQTTHMRSAAVMALSRLTFEYARVDVDMRATLPAVLKTVTVLFDEKSREVVKAVVGFVRVSVAAMEKEDLEPLLPDLVGGLMKYDRGSGRFRAKIKIILKRLVRAYGYEVVGKYVPESDTRLLTHMRKLEERAKRRKAANMEDGGGVGGDDYEDMMGEEEMDSDDGKTFRTGMTGFTKMTGVGSRKALTVGRTILDGRSIKSTNKSMISSRSSATLGGGPRIDTSTELKGDVLDMLDPSVNKSVRFMDNDDNDEDSDFSDDGEAMEFDDDGKLLVVDDDDSGNITKASGGIQKRSQGMEGTRRQGHNDTQSDKRIRISKFESAKIRREETHLKKSQSKGRRDSQSKDTPLGAEFKSKKAGGDVKKKSDTFEPYAYVPLDGKSYTKKNRAGSVAQMSSVVRGGRGNKSDKKRRRR